MTGRHYNGGRQWTTAKRSPANKNHNGATIWLPGGGGGLVRLEYFFYMFSESEFFFQHHRGLDFLVLQCMMREVIFFIVPFVWIIICIKSVICLEKTTIHNLQIYNKEQFFPQFIFHLGHIHSSSGGSVLVLLALIVLKHLHQGCGTPEDYYITCSQTRTQLLASSMGGRGSPTEFFLNLYARWWHLRAISTIFRQWELCPFSDFHSRS